MSERAERNALTADVAAIDPELQQAFLEVPSYAKVLPSVLDEIRERALKAQHGEDEIAEVQKIEDAVRIAEDTVVVARQEVAFDVGGLAKFNEAAAPYEKAATAPWLRKYRASVPMDEDDPRYVAGARNTIAGEVRVGKWVEGKGASQSRPMGSDVERAGADAAQPSSASDRRVVRGDIGEYRCRKRRSLNPPRLSSRHERPRRCRRRAA
jgi:hypothetical protein